MNARNNNIRNFNNNLRNRNVIRRPQPRLNPRLTRYRNPNIRRRGGRTFVFRPNSNNQPRPMPRKKNTTTMFKEITSLIKRNGLGGGPLKSLNEENKKNVNNPNKSNKEIRHDKLYSAMDMYLMGKYYSFFKTSNMIVRIAIYTTHTFTILGGTNNGSFIWFPYFYPYIIDATIRSSSENKKVDVASNFFLNLGDDFGASKCNPTDVNGNYRLISATMKVSNTTSNSLKAGSFTMYRLTQSQSQPIYYRLELGIHNDEPIQELKTVMNATYTNEPVKYLYNANQVAICNEYGVIEGNTIFQATNEYMGSKTLTTTSLYTTAAGGTAYNFNPTGVNVKYLCKFDEVGSNQTYKVQCFQVFEVTPLPSSTLSTLSFKGDRSVISKVIQQAKNKFNFEVGKE